MVISKIEALRPNVLLVEKSVSSYAQDLLLAKEISLVLNVKRPLLERIARCTGALITPSIDNISTTRLGHCELFKLEKVSEEHETSNQFNKKPSKTLMYFEGCPRRLGCTVVFLFKFTLIFLVLDFGGGTVLHPLLQHLSSLTNIHLLCCFEIELYSLLFQYKCSMC